MIAILDRSLNVLNRLQPEKMALNLEERKSTASFDLPLDAPEIPGNAWLRDETEPGAGIIWREKTSGETYERETQTIQLEHIISTLKDDIIFGELTPADISGISGATTCSAEQAARKVLTYQNQTIWALGDFEYNVSNPYSFNGDNLFGALETITSSLEGACWEYDLTQLPFRLHIRRLPSEASCEMRLNRNLSKIKKTVDRSRMYTRFYPVGKNDLHISGNYVSRNENIYGVICRTETDQSKATEAELRAWAEVRLRNHCEPSVTVQGSGIDLSRATGEPLDKLKINAMCRVPLPKYGTMITEKVTKLNWPDKIQKPEEFSVTLANLLEDVASIINNATKASGKANRAAAKDAKEKHAWLINEDDHVGLLAEAVAGPGADKDWSRVASVTADGEGIHQRVTKTEGNIVTAFTQIDLNEERIKLEAQRATNAEGALTGKIQVEAGKINQVVSAVGKDGEVTAASICLAINEAGDSEATINAGKIYLLGQTIANTITADFIQTRVSSMNVLSTKYINANGNVNASGNMLAGGFYLKSGDGIHTTSLAGAVHLLQIVQDGNSYKLQKKDFDDDEWTDVGSFSRATSLSGAWSSNTFTVTASPQGNTVSVTPQIHIPTGTGTSVTAKIGTTTQTQSGTEWVDHDGDKQLHLIQNGLTVYLRNRTDSSGFETYAQTTIPDATVSGTWSSNTWTATSSHGGSAGITPKVHMQTGDTATVHAKIGTLSGGSWTDHDGDEYAYLVQDGRTVYLNKNNAVGGSGNVTYGKTTIPAGTVSGTWSSNTWTATGSLGGSDSVTPKVHMISGSTATVHAKIGTLSGGSWTDHDGDEYAYLVKSGLTVYLNKNNAVGGSGNVTYGQVTCSDSNLTAGNIKNGVTIFGVTGNYSGGGNQVTWQTAKCYATSYLTPQVQGDDGVLHTCTRIQPLGSYNTLRIGENTKSIRIVFKVGDTEYFYYMSVELV